MSLNPDANSPGHYALMMDGRRLVVHPEAGYIHRETEDCPDRGCEPVISDPCMSKAISTGQPSFTLLAQDKSAPQFVEQWISLNKDTLSPEHLQAARSRVREMRAWQAAHLDQVKWPD